MTSSEFRYGGGRYFVSNVALIEAVKNCPMLWDSGVDEYKDVEQKKAKWLQLSEKFGVSPGTHDSCCCTLRILDKRITWSRVKCGCAYC